MDNKAIEKIIMKALLEEITEEEQGRLDNWLNESAQNKSFFEGLNSGEFLQRAAGDRNRRLRDREWDRLKEGTIGKHVRKIRLRVLKLVASIMLPLAVAFGAWHVMRTVDKQDEDTLVQQSIQAGGSKALVMLSSGKTLRLLGDSTVRMNDRGMMLVSQKDTLSLTRAEDSTRVEDSFTVISIPRGGEYIVRLEDGTMVHLNSDSELRVPVTFSSDKREVWLKGEAYFNVRHEAERRFIVKTDKIDVTVLGTEFAVKAYESGWAATLVKGSVEVTSEKTAKRIVPGEQAKVDAAGDIIVKEVNVNEHIAWTLGRIIFENVRLDDIMNELQRWYDFDVSYANPVLKDLRFTIDVIKYKEAADVFELMEKIGKVLFVIKGNKVILK